MKVPTWFRTRPWLMLAVAGLLAAAVVAAVTLLPGGTTDVATDIADDAASGQSSPTLVGGSRVGDSPGITVVTDPAQQADLLSKCATGASCKYSPASDVSRVSGPRTLITASGQPAKSCSTASKVKVEGKTEVSTVLSLDIEVSEETNLGGVVKVGMEASWGWEWETADSIAVSDTVPLKPFSVAYLYMSAAMLQVTGQFFIQDGDQMWQLPNVVVKSPDTSAGGVSQVSVATRPMTPAEKAACPRSSKKGGRR